MADVDNHSQTPVRSEQDAHDRVQVKIVDESNPNTQAMTVDTDKNAHVEMHGNKPTGVDVVMRLSEEGAPNGDGLYDVTNNTIPDTSGITAQTRNAAYAASRQNLSPTAKRGASDTDTVSLDISLHDENGDKFSTSNPLPVVISNEEIGTAVHAQDSSASAVAVLGTYTYTYTVATSALSLKRIVISCIARMKVEINIGAVGSPPRKYVLFLTAGCPNFALDIPKNFIVAIADVVQVKYTNEDTVGATVYTTIEGTSGA